jgi:hypothetical protein
MLLKLAISTIVCGRQNNVRRLTYLLDHEGAEGARAMPEDFFQ